MQIQPTLSLLKGLHFRLAYLMNSLSESDLEKSFIHEDNKATFQLKEIIGTYAWHGNHHLGQIIEFKKITILKFNNLIPYGYWKVMVNNSYFFTILLTRRPIRTFQQNPNCLIPGSFSYLIDYFYRTYCSISLNYKINF